MATTPATVSAALVSSRTHWLRSSPYGDTNLSQFTCSCGQIFIPPFATMPREWPSLAKLHESLALSVAVAGELIAPRLSDLPEVSPGAVFLGGDGKLYRFLGRDDWVGQDGRAYQGAAADTSNLTLIWLPA